MSQQCPRCRQTLDFSGVPLSFCGYCGAPLKATTPPDPDATLAAPADPATLSTPERLGEYRLLRCLGRGGMGVVHEGEHEPTGRRVAIKLIDLAASGDALDRFRREGKLAACVSHPRCVFVQAVDEDAGRPYIVMELMPGRTLEDLVREEGPLPSERAIDRTLDLIEGLEQVHALGVIHRDVKPSNCFLDPEGRVKVGDFGLARSLAPEAKLTRTGTFVGTPLFAAPEQIMGQALDVRADVYAVCATLWFLLTGRAPHEAGDGDALATLARVVADDPPPLRSLRPDLPAGLERLLARGLARDRQRRPADLATLAVLLRAFRPLPAAFDILASRAIAYAVDTALLVAPFMLWSYAGGDSLTRDWTWAENIVAAGISAVWFSLWEGLTALTPGKWLLGLRVYGRSDVGPPGLGRALGRAAICELLILLSNFSDPQGDFLVNFGLLLLVVVAPLALLLSTVRRRNGYRCLHDFLTGTRVVGVPKVSATSGFPARLPAAGAAPSSPARLGPYHVQGQVWEEEGHLLRGVDEGLDRPVWLLLRPAGSDALAPARRALVRPARLRWLADGEQDGWHWDAFVAPSGGPLVEAMQARVPLDWEEARPVLEALAGELAGAQAEGTLPGVLSLSQVWVTPAGRVQLLDVPCPGSARLSSLDLLAEVAVLLLEGRPRGDRRPPRAALPLFARRLLDELPRFGGSLTRAAEFQERLADCAGRPARVVAASRLALLGVLALVAGLPLLMVLVGVVWVSGSFLREVEVLGPVAERLLVERRQREAGSAALVVTLSHPLARLASAADLAVDVPMTSILAERLEKARRHTQDRARCTARVDRFLLDNFPLKEFQWLAETESLDLRTRATVVIAELHLDSPPWWALPALLAFVPALCILAAFLFRGGLRHYLLGVRVVRRDGRRAGRLRCAWRALAAWAVLVPLLVWYALLEFAWQQRIAYLGDLCWIAFGLLALVGLVVMLRTPARSLHDRLAGTTLVPR